MGQSSLNALDGGLLTVTAQGNITSPPSGSEVIKRDAATPSQSTTLLLPKTEQSQPQAPHPTVVLSKSEQKSLRMGQSSLNALDGGLLTVTAQGNITSPPSGSEVIKRDVSVRTNDGSTVTMIIDPTTFYQHGSQKMYRLVNVSELSADSVPVSSSNNCVQSSVNTEDLKILTISQQQQPQQQQQQLQLQQQRRKRGAPLSAVQGIPNGRNEDVLDDGLSEKRVTVEQEIMPRNDRIVLEQRPVVAVA
ncbi:unnamed protein product, partial [Gongylonema pulchrum]|uniref:CG10617 n=1 Tax=Gongylonema pulchrum TaxID=637853 RepID=A0A183E1Y0_9BILA